jgi:hypothetical protein
MQVLVMEHLATPVEAAPAVSAVLHAVHAFFC